MLLKQIEINGFKSFANDTVLTFEKGITAVVGPNGSGKSNIVDAVRWVLGEQKVKQLRGDSMKDVIFSGTENKKPQSFAYVSLTIDNKDRNISLDYDEITVSRRLYRSGDSEYKLNGKECRLKDINEIFYDTGIGKEGYSIIGQGQIDRILSNKPEDRRELFDEAAGIVKFKRNKNIAISKLEQERLNLTRVTDIINELKSRVEPLKQQSESAKKYLEYRDTLIDLEANFYVREIDKQTQIIKENNDNLALIKNDLQNVENKVQEFNEKYNEIENNISKIDIEMSAKKDKLFEINTNKEKLNGEINVIKEQINHEILNNKNHTEKIEELKKSLFEYVKNIENDYNVANVVKSQVEFIISNKDKIEEEIYSESLSSKENIEKSLQEAKNSIYEIFGNDYNFDINDKVKENLFDDNSALLNVSKIQNEVENIDEDIKNKNDLLDEKSKVVVSLLNDINILNDNINEIKNEYYTTKTKLETIKNMLERYEGYSNTVKTIMDSKNNFSGIKGVVADLINTKKEYEVAIEVAIGGSLQNIVMEDTDSTKKVIEYLKNNKLGRASFLPLSDLVVKSNDEYARAKSEVGVVDIASNLVTYANEYERLINYLLSRCLIVDTFDNAKAISKKYNGTLKIVTLSGELFNPGGAISGGAYKNSTNLIGRKREYEDLILKENELKNKLSNVEEDKKNKNNEYNNLITNINELKEEINKLTIDKNTKKLNIISNIKIEWTQINSQIEWTLNDLQKLLDGIKKVFVEKTTLESSEYNFKKAINEKNEKINSINKEIEVLNDDYSKINEEINSLDNTKQNYLSNKKEYYDSKDKLSSEVLTLEQQELRLNQAIENATNKIAEINEKNYTEYNMTYEVAKEKYKEIENPQDLKNNIKEIKKEIQSLGNINISAIEEYNEVSARYETMTKQYDDLKESEAKILDIVKELDENMKNQFEENFKFIKNEFDKVFKELFGGGKATLTLDTNDTKDILDQGILINVEPPGKKISNLSQLSGGEKSLTAIALLFAIQNLKPSPFCILDELDAALDENNVDEFISYVNTMTEKTQFILITHRRGTMEKADRLYGVTMQEKGVTALVSVNLIEDKLS